MPHLNTDAIVLHILDYSETSRILRLATREAGMVSVLARGARRSRSRFGSALDLFAEGVAQLSLRESRDLQTLAGFDVVRSHPELGANLERFAAASALAELVLRFGTEEGSATLFEVLSHALADIAAASPQDAREAGLAAAWRLVAELGFAPAVFVCGACHTELRTAGPLTFSTAVGGALCERCARLYPPGRTLPVEAREQIHGWCEGRSAAEGGGGGGGLPAATARAHQRLLREFLAHHLTEGRPLRAFDAWERGSLVDG